MVLTEEAVVDGNWVENTNDLTPETNENNTIHAAAPLGWKELHWAARNGNTHLVKQLLQKGAATESR